MRNDARAHGVLSESSVSLHIHAHDRKGDRREERGSEGMDVLRLLIMSSPT